MHLIGRDVAVRAKSAGFVGALMWGSERRDERRCSPDMRRNIHQKGRDA
jgi:hypothetical protein